MVTGNDDATGDKELKDRIVVSWPDTLGFQANLTVVRE